jgi:hypothetical protein
MHRNKLLLITIVALQLQGLAQHLDSVQVTLALKDGKTTYRTGEGIVLATFPRKNAVSEAALVRCGRNGVAFAVQFRLLSSIKA